MTQWLVRRIWREDAAYFWRVTAGALLAVALVGVLLFLNQTPLVVK